MTKLKNSRKLLFGRTIFVNILITLGVTLLVVYFSGLASHRTILQNSLISLTILAVSFFLFLSISLFYGFNVYDNLSHKLGFKWNGSSVFDRAALIPKAPDIFETEDGLSGILVSIVLWVIVTIAMLLFLVFLEFVLWAAIIGLIGLIYWVIMRALKLIFSKSEICENNLLKSVYYGFVYTILYISWIYGVVYISSIL